MVRSFQVVAHRGCRSLYPENTLEGFRKAISLGVDAVEFDVHPTRDGKLVITHDDTLERCSNGTGMVHDHTLAELKALDFGSWKGHLTAGFRISRSNAIRKRTKIPGSNRFPMRITGRRQQKNENDDKFDIPGEWKAFLSGPQSQGCGVRNAADRENHCIA